MKKILFWILTFLWIWLSFCSASFWDIPDTMWSIYLWSYYNDTFNIVPTVDNSVKIIVDDWYWVLLNSFSSFTYYLFDSSFNQISIYDSDSKYLFIPSWTYYVNVSWSITWTPNSDYAYQKNHNFSHFSVVLPDLQYFPIFNFFETFYYNVVQYSFSAWSSTSDIDVYYNNWNSVESITCDWTQAIEIQWLSTITSTNTFMPYFNIDYVDENNQLLTESYSKDILYLSGSAFKKTYTWNNIRILTSQWWNSESIFTWYLPTFDITWWINEVTESWNIFNNFAENSVKFTLANIPSYIQYFIILLILFLILWFVKKFKRK